MTLEHFPRGWYPDPQRQGFERFWDGQQATQRIRRDAASKKANRKTIMITVVASVMVFFGLVTALALTAPPAQQTATIAPSTTPTTSLSATATASPTTPSSSAPSAAGPKITPKPAARPTPIKPAVSRPASPRPTTAARTGPALAAASRLTVKGRAPKTGYQREAFGQTWADIDRNGCDQRNDVLGRDLTDKTYKPGTRDCVVLTGLLNDPYSGKVIIFHRGNQTSAAVQIDHVVALSDAWQKGAQQWDSDKRAQFANDHLNLLAVDGPLNAQKQDSDTATWLPPNKAARCGYVARQVAVKHTYTLWVTRAEHDAMIRILTGCPGQALPTSTMATGPKTNTHRQKAPAPAKTTPAKPKPPAPHRTSVKPTQPKKTRQAHNTVHPGAFCSPEGATGVTVKGTPMRCSTKSGDTRARWRKAG